MFLISGQAILVQIPGAPGFTVAVVTLGVATVMELMEEKNAE